MWVRDFFTRDLDHQLGGGTRVLTYGYDSTLLENNSNAGISEFARTFLETLKNAHRLPDVCSPLNKKKVLVLIGIYNQEHQRPIVFVAQSLGGIVLQQVRYPYSVVRDGSID